MSLRQPCQCCNGFMGSTKKCSDGDVQRDLSRAPSSAPADEASRVAKSTSYFTGGPSAIDLWGIAGDKGLFLFELKKAENKKLGALAELFFYSMVMNDVQRGVLGFGPTKANTDGAYHAIPKTKSIDAYILAPDFHPLIKRKDAAVLKIFNEAFASAGMPIRFGLARLLAQHPFVEIAKQA